VSKKAHLCCSICGETPVTSRVIDDGAIIWHCQDHLEGDEREIYEELLDEGWEAPPPRTLH
jgi:hypothetical protein